MFQPILLDPLHITYVLVYREAAPLSTCCRRAHFFRNAGQRPPAQEATRPRNRVAQSLRATPDSAVAHEAAEKDDSPAWVPASLQNMMCRFGNFRRTTNHRFSYDFYKKMGISRNNL